MSKHPQNLEELLLDDSFVRWLRGQADIREETYWRSWEKQHPNNKRLAERAKQALRAMQFKGVDTTDVESELEKLNSRIDAATDSYRRSHFPKGIRRNKIYLYISAAAIALIVFSAGIFALNRQLGFLSKERADTPVQTKIEERIINTSEKSSSKNNTGKATEEVTTGYAEKSTVIFEDGTKVVLNAKSSLKYPAEYDGGDIIVDLEGEAYFQVAKQKKYNRQFTVRTKDGSISVLGTKFSVQSRDEKTNVALKQGAVEINTGDNGYSGKKLRYTMKPGELAQFSKKSSTIKIDEINPDVYLSWMQSVLLFDNTSLSEVIQRIEQTYGVDVEVQNRSLLEKEISGSIQNNDLNILLKALSELLQKPINRNKTTVTIGH